MESIHTELALYGSRNKCARTDIVFLAISEVCNGTASRQCKVEYCKLVDLPNGGARMGRVSYHLGFTVYFERLQSY